MLLSAFLLLAQPRDLPKIALKAMECRPAALCVQGGPGEELEPHVARGINMLGFQVLERDAIEAILIENGVSRAERDQLCHSEGCLTQLQDALGALGVEYLVVARLMVREGNAELFLTLRKQGERSNLAKDFREASSWQKLKPRIPALAKSVMKPLLPYAGSSQALAVRSCKWIREQNLDQGSGIYWIDPEGGPTHDAFRVYCDMETHGGGWTLVLKTDGKKGTFRYDSPLWGQTRSHAPDAVDLDTKEHKNEAYHRLNFTEVRVGMQVGDDQRWIRFSHPGKSLHSLIADGRYRPIKGPDRKAWKKLIANSSLQSHCNQQGFNANRKYAFARIGLIANQEKDCNTPDSSIGIGIGGFTCGKKGSVNTGNRACYFPDNGDRDLGAYGFVMVR